MHDTLSQIKRWYFWVLCPLVMLLGCLFWFLGVRSIDEEKQTNRQMIDSLYEKVSAIRRKPIHPNPDTARGMQELIHRRRKQVAEAWTQKYLQQTADETEA